MLCLTQCCISLLVYETMGEMKKDNNSDMPVKVSEDQYFDAKIQHNVIKKVFLHNICVSENKGLMKKNSNLYFKFSLEEFIDCYNAVYYVDKGVKYIQPCSEWYSYTQDFGRYKGDMHYEFTADKKIWTLPTITVYTLQNKTVIKELTVDFDDHSYTDKMYKKYEEMCFYTLKVFFPDMDAKDLTKLYKKLNKIAYVNIFQNDQGFHSDTPPRCLYYRNGVGVYPYFAYGESVRMCIIPVTKKIIKSYKKQGVKIHKF